MKSIFEQIGGTYTMQGDYRLPNLTLPAEERHIGVWLGSGHSACGLYPGTSGCCNGGGSWSYSDCCNQKAAASE